jgi:hypothetical protein
LTTALAGRLDFNLRIVGRKRLQIGQPYENTSVTSTLPWSTEVGCAGTIKK